MRSDNSQKDTTDKTIASDDDLFINSIDVGSLINLQQKTICQGYSVGGMIANDQIPSVAESINAIENLNSTSIHPQENTISKNLSNFEIHDLLNSNISQKDAISGTLAIKSDHSIDAGSLIQS